MDRHGDSQAGDHQKDIEFLESRASFSPDTGLALRIQYRVSPSASQVPELYVNWGHGSNGATWTHEEVVPSEIVCLEKFLFEIRKSLYPETAGEIGVSAHAVFPDDGTVVRQDNQKILVGLTEDTYPDLDMLRQSTIKNLTMEGDILRSLRNYDRFARSVFRLSSSQGARNLGKILFDLAQQHRRVADILSDYHDRAACELRSESSPRRRRQARRVLSVLQYIGVGEVMLVAAEGPHAAAGGLAHVVTGLLRSFSRHGIPVTLVTPMYEEPNGNKHPSAETLIGQGVKIDATPVPIHPVGMVKVPFGPTYRVGTGEMIRPPFTAVVQVYRAEHGKTRIFFLRHARLADRLYANAWSDEQLRRAIFLSRGALEIIRDPSFGAFPHIVISNDWHTGLLPVFLKTDPRYTKHESMEKIQTIHMLHNCGRDYQGRFAAHMWEQDLWPLLNLPGEHFFGLRDPRDPSLINITTGAIFHVTKAILTVSKSYATELLRNEGGEGLNTALQDKEHLLFGISNGIDLVRLHKDIWQAWTENVRNPAPRSGKFSKQRIRKHLQALKHATKRHVQIRHQLETKNDAILLSFVGRLAEQKGIDLFYAFLPGERRTVVESILEDYPQVQLFVGGSPTEGDLCVPWLGHELARMEKRFSGRVSTVFDFMPHQQAMEIIAASDLFLLPSRFEPGGITQLESFAVGTPVVARRTGGIIATVEDYDESDSGCGFLFSEYSGEAFRDALVRAITVIGDRAARHELMKRCLLAQHDWSDRLPMYTALLQHVAGAFSAANPFSFLRASYKILSTIRPAVQPRGSSS